MSAVDIELVEGVADDCREQGWVESAEAVDALIAEYQRLKRSAGDS